MCHGDSDSLMFHQNLTQRAYSAVTLKHGFKTFACLACELTHLKYYFSMRKASREKMEVLPLFLTLFFVLGINSR